MVKKSSFKKKKKGIVKNEALAQEVRLPSVGLSERFFSTPRWSYIAIFVLSFILYGNTLTLEYALDDRLMITENEFTTSGISGIKDILTNDSFVGFFGERRNLLSGGRYRPLSQVMFAIEYELFGLKPFIGHLINVLLYALSCVVLLKVLRLLFASYKGFYVYMPYLITLFFLAHPLHTEIVANIKGRDDIMSFLGSAFVLLLSLRYLNTPKVKYLVASGLIYFLTLMSKENAITFLGIIPLTLFFFKRPRFSGYVYTMAPLLLAAFAFIGLRFVVLGFELNIGEERELLNNPFVNASASEKYATIFYTMGVYLRLLFIPHPLTHDYYPFHIEIVSWSSPKAFVPLIIYLVMGIYAVWGIFKKHLVAYGIAFYLISFSIASNIVFNIGTLMNERFMYVSLLGFCIVLAYAVVYLSKRFVSKERVPHFIFGAALLILLLYAPKIITRNLVWKNDYTLFTTDVKVSVNSAKCNVSAGGVMLEKALQITDEQRKQEKYKRALKYISRGVEIHPRYTAGWILLGNANLYLENFYEALVCYHNALRLSPNNQDALSNMSHLAVVAQSRGFYQHAVEVFNVLSKYKTPTHDDRYNLARAYEGLESWDTAMRILHEIIDENPRYFNAHSKLGELYGKVYNNMDASLQHLHLAYEIKPDDASNLENMGIAYGILMQFETSLKFFEKALSLNPDKPELLRNISQTYAMMGNVEKAQAYLQEAQRVNVQ